MAVQWVASDQNFYHPWALVSNPIIKRISIFWRPIYTDSQKHESTLFHMYVLNEFLTAHHSCTKKDLKKTLISVGSSHLYASFDTFCVQISQLFEAQWDFQLSEEFKIDVIFLRKQWFYRFQTIFKDSLCLQKLTNLDSKGAKRSVKMWATNFY